MQALTADLETRVLSDIGDQFHSIGQLFIERPELIATIYRTPTKPGPEQPFTYYVLFFCAHIFHSRQRGIPADNEWTGWLQWMRNAFQYGTLASTWKEIHMESWFDPAFAGFRPHGTPASRRSRSGGRLGGVRSGCGTFGNPARVPGQIVASPACSTARLPLSAVA